jgi:hypothetical protein
VSPFTEVLGYFSLVFQMKCKVRHPPGDEIYRDGNVSVFEVDGRKNKVSIHLNPFSPHGSEYRADILSKPLPSLENVPRP